MSAEIICLDDFRPKPTVEPVDDLDDALCDIATAVDVAIRDLREILQYWGSEGARARALECERMLTRVLK